MSEENVPPRQISWDHAWSICNRIADPLLGVVKARQISSNVYKAFLCIPKGLNSNDYEYFYVNKGGSIYLSLDDIIHFSSSLPNVVRSIMIELNKNGDSYQDEPLSD